MNSNFQFLQQEWSAFYQRAIKAEKFVISDPRTSLAYARMALELAVNWMYENDYELELPYDKSLNSLMVNYDFKNQFTSKLLSDLHLIKKVGNLAIHNKSVNVSDSEKIISNLYYFSKWFAKSYGENDYGQIGLFDWEVIPKSGDSLSKKELAKIQSEFDGKMDKIHVELKEKEDQNKKLLKENELLRKQLEEQQAVFDENKNLASQEDVVQHPRNEHETRKYFIDVSLREAGWDLNGAKDKEFKVDFMPNSTNKSETGYIDYVLWDDDGNPLALVEAKKSMENATKGENQAQLYADSLEKMFGQRPVMYYTNGYETYLWDDAFYKKARPVHGFYTKQELQTLFYRRDHRKDIRTQPIDHTITDRTYQLRSIRSIAEHFAGNDKKTGELIGTNRGALLVLATGTGKTRTSIALCKMMLEANWVKRVLFLADRKSLVSQAKRNFSKFLPEHSSVNLLEDKDNPDTRLAFSTYATMMNLIDGRSNGDERFYGVGHFDLVIVDEAHRSIYKKYKSIFDYFDALFLGLTATPHTKIHRNTYSIFGLPDKSPTDAYTFPEAVKNKHLVPYKTMEVPTRFLTEGIKYEDLSEEEQEEFEEEILDGEEASGDEWVDSKALNKWLFNKNTTIKTLNYIIKHGIKNRSGEELGKTIIFARNKKHAQFIKDIFMDLDKELYGNDYVKVITHGEPKAEEFIQRFCDEEKERLPQIAVSVDMLDTGIDAPSVVNLVFYKPVKSYAKFWQMIGRGSRLRPNLFGPGRDKDKFVIFDLCGNFQFFKEHPDGIDSSSQKSLTEVVFKLKLDLAQLLKENYGEGAQEIRSQILGSLFQEISDLDRDRFEVRMNIEEVMNYSANRELWNHLDNKDLKIVTEKLAPLIKPKKGDSDLARFYDKIVYGLMINSTKIKDPNAFFKSQNTPISRVAKISKKLLKKTSIKEIADKKEMLQKTLDQDFWKQNGISHLEEIRNGLRDLVKFIDPTDQVFIITDFQDELDESKVVVTDPIINDDPVEYSPFANNLHRLQEIIRENKENITISRIRTGEQITQEELKSLESLLFSDNLKRDEVEQELGTTLDLVKFIIKLTGRSEESVDKAFAEFINDYQLNSVQIEFLDTIKLFLTKNGKINPEKLYDAPFKNYHSLGVDGVFNDKQADEIFDILEQFDQTNQVS